MEEQASSSKTAKSTKLKIAGSFSGVLEADLEAWTLCMLKGEVAKRSNCSPDCINLICGGKILKERGGGAKLIDLGLQNNSKILACKVSSDQAKAVNDEFLLNEERSRRLERIRAAADALSKRHSDGSLPLEDFNIELEDQSGKKVQLGCENDQRGIMMGLMLHANAKRLMKKQSYVDALDVLEMAEEAFSLSDPKFIERIDNVPILQIDTVWCYFMLRDISWLSMAGVRLTKAREGIERSYGKDCSRARVLHGGYHPECPIYLRLELLEGVVAYHSGHLERAQKALTSAQAKYHQLQVKDEALSLLMSMGYKEQAAKRALRMSNQVVEIAVNFLVDEKEKVALRHQEDERRKREIKQQQKYGMTPLKKAVDLERLNELVSIGFEELLAAEALRRNENDTQRALDELTNPEKNAFLQSSIESKKSKRRRHQLEVEIEELISMGFERSRVVSALGISNNKEHALSLLITGQISNSSPEINVDENNASHTADHMDLSTPLDDLEASSSAANHEEERDKEMEDEIARELTGDPVADYDIEITKEGEAIAEYLALVASAANADCTS